MVEDFLRRQDGIITLTQARTAGMSEWSVRRRVRSGQWRRCASGVYFADDRPFTPAARIRAAVWSRGLQAVASGLTAAWWLGLTDIVPDIVEITVPRNSHGRAARGTRIRRRNLSEVDITEFRRLSTTAPALTVIEASVSGRGDAEIMDAALQRHLSLDELQFAHERNKGRRGAPATQRLLTAAAGGARSEAERLIAQLLREAKITGWQANFRVGNYIVDIAFPARGVAIEIDGWAFHSDQEAFQRDRVRQNRLALQGWQVLRFTWLDLVQHSDRVLAQVCTAIAAR